MAPDQIFVIALLIVCFGVVAWLSVKSHKADALRLQQDAATVPAPEPLPAQGSSRKARR